MDGWKLNDTSLITHKRVCHVLCYATAISIELLNYRWRLTVKKVWNAVLEVDKCGEGGDAVVISGSRVGDLDKVNSFAVAIVVNRLQTLQNLVGLCRLWVVWRK